MLKNLFINKSLIMMNKKVISSLIKNSIFYQFGNIKFNKKRRNSQSAKSSTQKISKQLFLILQRQIKQAQTANNQPQQSSSSNKSPTKNLEEYQNIPKLQKSLQKIGWKVQKLDGRLQFTKYIDQYKFSAFITIKPPLQISHVHKQMLIKKKEHEIEFIQAQIKKVRQNLMQLKLKGPMKGPSKKVGQKAAKDADSSANNSIENASPSVLEKRLKQLAGILFHLQQQKMDCIYDQFICQISLFIEKTQSNNPSVLQQINPISQKTQPIHLPLFINKPKTPPKPYLCLQYIANSKYAQLNQLKTYFFNSNKNKIIKNRIQRLSSTINQYVGPQLDNLDPQLVDLVGTWLVNDLELRKQVFMTMYNLFVFYENKEYVEWLKEMKEMLIL